MFLSSRYLQTARPFSFIFFYQELWQQRDKLDRESQMSNIKNWISPDRAAAECNSIVDDEVQCYICYLFPIVLKAHLNWYLNLSASLPSELSQLLCSSLYRVSKKKVSSLQMQNFLRVEWTKSWTSCAQMKAGNMRNLNLPLHVQIGASKP